MTHYSSYDPEQVRPVVGSLWVWEPDKAPEIIRVTRVLWNGEEWWVQTECIPPARSPLGLLGNPHVVGLAMLPARYWNELSRFWEAAHHVRMAEGPPGTKGTCRRGAAYPDELESGDEH